MAYFDSVFFREADIVPPLLFHSGQDFLLGFREVDQERDGLEKMLVRSFLKPCKFFILDRFRLHEHASELPCEILQFFTEERQRGIVRNVRTADSEKSELSQSNGSTLEERVREQFLLREYAEEIPTISLADLYEKTIPFHVLPNGTIGMSPRPKIPDRPGNALVDIVNVSDFALHAS